MSNSEDLQAAIMEVTLDIATAAAVRPMREADPSTEPHTRRRSSEEPHNPRQATLMLSQPAFNWKALDRYVELLNFEMEVTNVSKQKCMISVMKRRCPL